MSSNYKITPLLNACQKITVGHVGTTSKFYAEKGIIFIRTQNVTNSGLDLKDVRFITDEFHQSIQKSRVVAGDLLLSRVVTDEMKSVIIPPDIGEANCANVILIRPSKDLIAEYLRYLIYSPDAQKYLLGKRVGSAQQVVNTKVLREWICKLPPIPEQQRIVAILDQAFADIEKARANAEKNLKNARELFDSYLDGICSSKSLLPSRLIGDVCSLYQGIAINKKSKHLLVEKSSLPLLRIKDLKNNCEEQYVSEEGYPVNSRVFEEDILYTRTGSLGLVFRGRNGVLHNNSFKVVPNDSIDKNYLFWWLQHASFKKTIMRLALKAAQPDITHAIFKIQKIEIPLLDDQKNWVENIERQKIITDDLAVIYKSKLLALDELKKSLLQKAFSGELTKDKGIAA